MGANKCSLCHGSHDSRSDKLLVLPGNQLCLNCHVNNSTTEIYHENKANEDCIACHKPHSADNKFLLIKSDY